MRASWALGQFLIVFEQVLEVVVAPFRRRRGPNNFQAAADRVIPFARAKFVLPAEALLLDAGGFRHWADILVRIRSTMGFAEGVTAGNERNRLLVIHRHARESLSDIPCRGERIRLSI